MSFAEFFESSTSLISVIGSDKLKYPDYLYRDQQVYIIEKLMRYSDAINSMTESEFQSYKKRNIMIFTWNKCHTYLPLLLKFLVDFWFPIQRS